MVFRWVVLIRNPPVYSFASGWSYLIQFRFQMIMRNFLFQKWPVSFITKLHYASTKYVLNDQERHPNSTIILFVCCVSSHSNTQRRPFVVTKHLRMSKIHHIIHQHKLVNYRRASFGVEMGQNNTQTRTP